VTEFDSVTVTALPRVTVYATPADVIGREIPSGLTHFLLQHFGRTANAGMHLRPVPDGRLRALHLEQRRDGGAGDQKHERHRDQQFGSEKAGLRVPAHGSPWLEALVFRTVSVDDAFIAPPKPRAIVAVTVMRFRSAGSSVGADVLSSTRHTRW
jgi:hypothetical protein